MHASRKLKRVRKDSSAARKRVRHLIEDYLAREKRQKLRLRLLCRVVAAQLK